MRLYLLPISTRRTLLYAQRLNINTSTAQKSYLDKAVNYAAKTWAAWEQKDSGWQRKVVDYGNQALRRIPYEEWGLKSVPPLSARRQAEEIRGQEKIQLVFPASALPVHKVQGVIQTLATERDGLHRKRLLYCIVGMPLTIPIGILPVIPNLPFFYLVYRAWSHWRAILGGKHVKWLIDKQLLQTAPSSALDTLYSDQVKQFTETLGIPALTVELERAIWQVETDIRKKDEEESKAQAATRIEEVKEDKNKDHIFLQKCSDLNSRTGQRSLT
ncbi:uncharacterized protein J7T54_007068 [Emericellopsis cladophorae]|uniref:Mitochondrial K+-H+ exchange-related-domain-containing protein n=1 Tax=Emericellopsis cladophorae TaxID=2686198 RepID=A0A9P9Y8I2_9HYPO|nr:uncharacterized protein J7T54_007068 [Emericellopsis cladophorae]KAI6785426.1 hypothetical protein J7T54_007068 [Emericellopsis cladophorae]